jgi:hypothetical protein
MFRLKDSRDQPARVIFAQYSVYPGKILETNRSSSKSRHIKNGITAASTSSPQYEPSALEEKAKDPLQ